ncbi:hypothetical protein [Helicobacter heilmannii]|uniref:hypothetical protein n=1 Tax=Helicobacter heilmannii TaxID=35817 RepID=UPI000CF1969E|nr:hypothetical protein [Helicobacter heilmannii]
MSEKFSISVSKPSNFHALDHWSVVEFKTWTNITTGAIKYDVSVAVFSDTYTTKHQRGGENVIGLHPYLFYDVDNDKDGKKKPLSIKEACDLFARHKIAFAIVPSRNYMKIKESDPRPNVERFRIIVPLDQRPPVELVKDKELFRKFQELFAQKLGILDYTDDAPLRDMARYYAKHETPPLMSSIIVQGRFARVDKIFAMAQQELTREHQEKEAQLAKRKHLAEQRAQRQPQRQTQNISMGHASIVTADAEAINAIPIADLIKIFEGEAQEYTEGKYSMLKTATAKYSITDDNVAYDFKSSTGYGVYAYLSMQLGTPIWNNIARKLGEVMGYSFLIQDPAFGNVLKNAIDTAKSRQEVEQKLKAYYGVRYVRFENNFIKVADQTLDYPNAQDKERYFALPAIV